MHPTPPHPTPPHPTTMHPIASHMQIYEGGRGLGFHFDKDEHAMSEQGQMVNPILSSVLYLTGSRGDSLRQASVPARCTAAQPRVPAAPLPHALFSHPLCLSARPTPLALCRCPSLFPAGPHGAH
jgi:hypothetical protein